MPKIEVIKTQYSRNLPHFFETKLPFQTNVLPVMNVCVCVVPWSVDFPTTMKTGGKKSGSHSSSRGSSSLQCRQVAELFPSSSGRRKTKREEKKEALFGQKVDLSHQFSLG